MARWIDPALAVGGGLVVLGLAAGASALGIPTEANGDAGARFFPLIASGALVALGALELRRGSLGKAPPASPETDAAHEITSAVAGGRVRVLALLILALLYAGSIGKLGYVVPTSLAAALAMALFGVRRPLALGAAALLCPALYHVLFFEMLGVFPPFGEWFDLLDRLRER